MFFILENFGKIALSKYKIKAIMSFTQKIIKQKSNKDLSENEIINDICSFVFHKTIISFIDSLKNDRYNLISLNYNNIDYKRHCLIKKSDIEQYKYNVIDILKDYICLSKYFEKDNDKIEVHVKPQYDKTGNSIEKVGTVFYVDIIYCPVFSDKKYFIHENDGILLNAFWKKRRLAIRCLEKGIFVELCKDGRRDPGILPGILDNKWEYIESRLY